MQWQVHGADKETGEPRMILVSADAEWRAVNEGNARGLMVEKAVLYRQELDQTADTNHGGERYTRIPQGVKMLEPAATIMMVCAFFCLIAGVVGVIVGLVMLVQPEEVTAGGAVIATAAIALFNGVFCFMCSGLLHVIAGIGLAVRDIALRNK